MGEIQPPRERPVELGVREDTHLFLEPGHLLFPEAGSQVVYHQGYKLAFFGLAVSHLRLLESFRRPSLQRIRGVVVRDDLYGDIFGPTPGAEISSFKARVSASMAVRSSLALVIRACSERTKRV